MKNKRIKIIIIIFVNIIFGLIIFSNINKINKINKINQDILKGKVIEYKNQKKINKYFSKYLKVNIALKKEELNKNLFHGNNKNQDLIKSLNLLNSNYKKDNLVYFNNLKLIYEEKIQKNKMNKNGNDIFYIKKINGNNIFSIINREFFKGVYGDLGYVFLRREITKFLFNNGYDKWGKENHPDNIKNLNILEKNDYISSLTNKEKKKKLKKYINNKNQDVLISILKNRLNEYSYNEFRKDIILGEEYNEYLKIIYNYFYGDLNIDLNSIKKIENINYLSNDMDIQFIVLNEKLILDN